MRARGLFVDLDGVLADFDEHYFRNFGTRLDRNGDEPTDLWANIRTRPRWFADLPLMPEAVALWDSLRPYQPTVLTGLSAEKAPPGSDAQKREWVARYFGADVPVIICRSRHKCRHGKAGDILIDDWKKYQHLWEQMGGVFILHTSVASTVAAMDAQVAKDSAARSLTED